MKTLYPEIAPYAVTRLKVSPLHTLYLEQSGRPDGLPVLFVHGGPGSGSRPVHRRFFDPRVYRIVLFDQRGAGRSTPAGELRENTTQALVADLERIREALGIDRWALLGGSWGATLALRYAQAHPDRVLGIILRGTFLASRRELEWFFADGASRLFPDHWDHFVGAVGVPAGSGAVDLVEAYHRALFSEHDSVRLRAARAWMAWGDTVALHTSPGVVDSTRPGHGTQALVSRARLQVHYASHRYFLDDPGAWQLDRIAHLPAWIVHGRCDVMCPAETAWRVHQSLPGSKLRILARTGHLDGEPAMVEALVDASDSLARCLR